MYKWLLQKYAKRGIKIHHLAKEGLRLAAAVEKAVSSPNVIIKIHHLAKEGLRLERDMLKVAKNETKSD